MSVRRIISILAGLAVVAVLVIVLVTSSGGSTGTSVGSASLPTITYQYGANPGPPRDVAEVNVAINKLLKPQGFQVRLEPIGYNSYDQKMKLKFSAGQPCDLVWTSYFSNDFNQLAAQGELLPLENLLPKYAPVLWNRIPRIDWRAATVDGHIYAALNEQNWTYPYGPIFRTSALSRFHIDLSQIHSVADVSPILARIKAAGISPVIYSDSDSGYPPYSVPFSFDSVAGFDTLIGAGGIADVRYNDPSLHVFNPVSTPEFRAGAQLARQWRLAGYYLKDDPPSSVASTEAQAGKFQVTFDQHNYDSQFSSGFGGTWKGTNTSPLFLTTNGIQTTMTGVCRNSKYPVDDVKFIEDLNSNQAIYMLMTHGIEGKHWVWADRAHDVIGYPAGVTATNDGYNPNTDWMFGDAFNAPYTTASEVGTNQRLESWNRTSPPSVALGFVVNAKPIESQLAQLATVTVQCEGPLLLGHVDVATGIPACIKNMNAAGEQKVLAEIQRQLIAWKRKV